MATKEAFHEEVVSTKQTRLVGFCYAKFAGLVFLLSATFGEFERQIICKQFSLPTTWKPMELFSFYAYGQSVPREVADDHGGSKMFANDSHLVEMLEDAIYHDPPMGNNYPSFVFQTSDHSDAIEQAAKNCNKRYYQLQTE